MGTRAPSAVTPCRGSNSTMGARAANAAPLNHDTGACTSHSPPRHASRSKKTAATTRRPHTRAGSSPLHPDREAAIGLRYGKANPNTPRSFTRFDPVSPRNSSGRSTLFPIKEEPTSLATSSLSSERASGNEPPRARNLFPLARAPLTKTPTGSTGPAPSLGTLTHVHQATSAPVAQDRDPTLRNGPVVTPRPPARSAGRYSREDTEELRLSSSSNSSELPAPSGAVRAASSDFTPKSDKATTRPPVGSGSRRAPEAGRSQTGTLQAQSAGDWCSQTGTLQAHMPNTASDGFASSTFDPSLEYSTDKVVLFWQPPSFFSQWSPSSFVIDAASYSCANYDPSLEYSTDKVVLFCQPPSFFSQWSPSSFVIDAASYSCAKQFMVAEKARLFKDHRAVELIMSSSDPSTHKRVGRGVRNF